MEGRIKEVGLYMHGCNVLEWHMSKLVIYIHFLCIIHVTKNQDMDNLYMNIQKL